MRLTRGCRAGGGVACSSLEYGGIRAATRRTPAPHDQLLPPDVASSSSSSFTSRSTRTLLPPLSTTFPQEHRRGPAAPSCRFLVSSVYSLCRQQRRRRRCSHFSPKKHCHCRSSSKAIRKIDRRKGTDTRSREEKRRNIVFIFFRMMH